MCTIRLLALWLFTWGNRHQRIKRSLARSAQGPLGNPQHSSPPCPLLRGHEPLESKKKLAFPWLCLFFILQRTTVVHTLNQHQIKAPETTSNPSSLLGWQLNSHLTWRAHDYKQVCHSALTPPLVVSSKSHVMTSEFICTAHGVECEILLQSDSGKKQDHGGPGTCPRPSTPISGKMWIHLTPVKLLLPSTLHFDCSINAVV